MSQYLDRPPRIQSQLPIAQVEIPSPPDRNQQQQPLWQVAVPAITIIAYVVVSATGRGSTITFLLPMALAVFISTAITAYNALTNWQERRDAQKRYRERLAELRREMVSSQNEQRRYYNYNYPDVATVLGFDGVREDHWGGTRLWERRPDDHDFGDVRIGIGTRATMVPYTLRDTEHDDSPLLRDARRLQRDAAYVPEVPISIPLFTRYGAKNARKNPTNEIREGASPRLYGIVGDVPLVYAHINNLVLHSAALHSPADLQICILGLHGAAEHWTWAYSLPHSQLNPQRGRTLIYFEDMERLSTPQAGTVTDIHVQPGNLIKPGQVVATMRNARGEALSVVSNHHAQVEMIPVSVGQSVKAGTMIVRTNAFQLTDPQYSNEESDPTRDLQYQRGKARKREAAGVPNFWKTYIWRELDARMRRIRDRDEDRVGDVDLPVYLLIVDMLAARPGEADDPLAGSWLDDVEGEAAIALIREYGAQLGMSVVFLVPERRKVPGVCEAVIDLETTNQQAHVRYAQTGLNTTRFTGQADAVRHQIKALHEYAKGVSRWQVRRSYGADVPRSVSLLQLYDTETVDGIEMARRWQESRDPERADWLRIPIGMLAGQESREIYFYTEADGVHGMIAGATGSGKSELLMTLIASLAVKYDPTVVNFVLVDYKGGATFDPFIGLPHVVDVVTNLSEGGVERLFEVIYAELDRRQRINQATDSKDIVRYRKRGFHLERNDNYPHLFFIIDEFAQMIAAKPDYKAQLDSITRLGRALGVSLILAAQRPSGVTDQMRANIKLRICLRVETKEESSELLRRPDASELPSIAGRGYLQVSSQSLELLQIGYIGDEYTNKLDSDPNERYRGRNVIWAYDVMQEEEEKLYEVIVRRTQQLANDSYPQGHTWYKPWPDPLPAQITLNAPDHIETSFLRADDLDFIMQQARPDEAAVLCPEINQWLRGQREDWTEVDYATRWLRAMVGLVDNTAEAMLYTLKIDLTRGHAIAFGAAGWGKSTFLRTLLTYLVATHSPHQLQTYILDFGNRALQRFTDLPHVGAFITAAEKERVARLLRLLEQELQERSETLANYESLISYNESQPPEKRLPAILVLIDNFAQFRAAFENDLPVLETLMRDGLANNIHFVVTATQTSEVGRLLNLLPTRISLRLSDESQYASIFNTNVHLLDQLPGRALVQHGRGTLTAQLALPIPATVSSDQTPMAELIACLNTAGASYTQPQTIDILEDWITLPPLLQGIPARQTAELPVIVLGKDDQTLEPSLVQLDREAHFIISGPPSSGKTTVLRTWAFGLAHRYDPSQAGLLFIDYTGGIVDYGGQRRLDELPNALGECVTEREVLQELVAWLENEYAKRTMRREIYVLIDAYEEIDQLVKRGDDTLTRLADLGRRHGRRGLHLVIGGLRDAVAKKDDLVRIAAANRYGVALSVEAAESPPFYGRVPRSYSQMDLPRGRGFLMTQNRTSLLQLAVPYQNENDKVAELDQWIAQLIKRANGRSERFSAAMSQDDAKTATQVTPQESAVNQPSRLTLEQRNCLKGGIARQLGLEIEDMMTLDSMNDADLLSHAANYNITLENCAEDQNA